MLHSFFPPDSHLEVSTTRQTTLSRYHQGPLEVLNALDRLAGSYGSERERVQRDLGIAESQLRDYEGWLGKPFSHEGCLAILTTLRDQLKAGLSSAAQEPRKQGGRSVTVLSDQIKAIKPANTIEAPPQRDRQNIPPVRNRSPPASGNGRSDIRRLIPFL